MTTSLSPVLGTQDMLGLQAHLHAAKANHPHVDCPDDPAPSTNTSLLSDPADPAAQSSGGTTTSEQQAALAQGAAQLLTQPIDIMA